jgi:SAM-dependent methyltransferase
VDRYYIERFLAEERDAIRGHVLEVMNAEYTERFGTSVERRDVLDIDPANEAATIAADLSAADSVPSDLFDCFILTQTLQYIYDLKAAVEHAHRILRPGGTLLCTVPAVSRIARLQLESEYWRVTPAACSRLFGDVFAGGDVAVRGHGNVLTAVAFLVGMAAEELSARELDRDDPFFPLVVTVRATKAPRRSLGGSGGRTYGREVPRLDFLEHAVLSDRSVLQPQRAAAEAGEHRMVVPGGDDDAPGVKKGVRALLEEVPELVVERFMDLVEDEDLGVSFLRDREPEPSLHPLRIGQHGTLERLTERAPRLHVAQGAHSGTTGETPEDAEQQRILAPREQGQQPGVDR